MTRKVASETHIGVSMEDYEPGSALLGGAGEARGSRPADSDGVSTVLVASTQVVGVAVLALTIVWVSLFLGGTSLSAEYPDLIFNLHPLFEVLGLVFIFGQGILTYRLLPLPKPTLKTIHATVNGLGLFFAVFGLWAVLKFHALRQIPDFYSLHSWFGITTIGLFLLQWLVGLYTFLYPGAPVATRQTVMPWHTFMGILIFVLALTTASQGALEKLTFRFAGGLAKRGAEALLVNSLGMLFFVWGALVLLTLRMDVSHPRRVLHPTGSPSG